MTPAEAGPGAGPGPDGAAGRGALDRLVAPGAWLDRATRWIAFIGLIGLMIATLFILADIVLRGVFDSPIEGLEDVTRFSFAIVVAACYPAGLIQGHNIAIRFLGKALGPRPSSWLEAFGAACTFVFFGLIGWSVVLITIDDWVNHHYTQTLHLPSAPFWVVISALVCLTVPLQLVIVALWLKRVANGEAAPPSQHGEGI